jgi:hypothetical protein
VSEFRFGCRPVMRLEKSKAFFLYISHINGGNNIIKIR